LIYFTSDLHFNHQRIIEYEPKTRPFNSVEEMNETLIANWNSVVKPEDTVYVLGDFAMGPANDVRGLVARLNGTIKLVRGNHDTPTKLKIYQEMGIEIKDIEYLIYKGRFFILCHFPIASPEFIQMVVRDNSEVVNVYGHLHSNAPKGYVNGTYHIGLDTNNLTPISIQQVWSECWPEEMMTPEIIAYKNEHEKS
jgi:calcineurin-like phosphoesterase family protein